MNAKNVQEVQSKLTKGLLDTIILEYMNHEGVHGYQIITKIRKDFGVYFGPSTIYPLLGQLEKKGYIKSTWDMNGERPKKIYKLTTQGEEILTFTMNSLKFMSKTLFENKVELQASVPSSKLLLATH